MSRRSLPTVQDIKSLLVPYFDSRKIEKAIIFGSFARGTATRRSDIDLMVIMNTKKRFFDRYDDFTDIGSILEGYHVDILVYTPAELDALSDRHFVRDALHDGIVIYGN